MRQFKKMRHALSMLELVFVIVILGIVSSIGAEVIAQTYDSYIVQRAQYRATTKTEQALNQIANRLRYAIPGTVGGRVGTGTGFIPVTNIVADTMGVLQWVAYDGDSFEAISTASRNPGWSGLCDLTASSASVIASPGSNLGLASTIIGNLGGSIATSSLYFPDGSAYGIASVTGENITLDVAVPAGSKIYERYKLAWSSYALSVEAGDLYLYYNFSPAYAAALGGNKKLLLKDVDNFRFKGSEGSLRVKVCKSERISMDANEKVRACKEKVIF